jgi:hypothetical protein
MRSRFGSMPTAHGPRPAPAAELPLDQPFDVGRLAQAQQAHTLQRGWQGVTQF